MDWLSFLKKYKTNESNFNFVAIPTKKLNGGKFFLPRTAFFDQFTRQLPLFSEDCHTGLVWVPPKRKYLPPILDFDFQRATKDQIPLKNITELVAEVCSVLKKMIQCDEFMAVVTRKKCTYLKSPPLFAGGFHLYLFGILVTKTVLQELKVNCFSLLEEFSERFGVLNSVESIFDDALVHRRNGLILLHDWKGLQKGKGHHCVSWNI